MDDWIFLSFDHGLSWAEIVLSVSDRHFQISPHYTWDGGYNFIIADTIVTLNMWLISLSANSRDQDIWMGTEWCLTDAG